MHNPASVILKAANLIANRGYISAKAAKSTNPWSSGPLTLHSALRISCDMDPADSVFAYWQWRDVRSLLDSVWGSLDDRVAQVSGERLPSIVWANQDDRSAEEVVELLKGVNPDSTPEVETITRRPKRNPRFVSGGTVSPARGSFLLGDGTLQTSLVVSIVVLKEQGGRPYGNLFSELAQLNLDNESLLAHVDDAVIAAVGDVNEIADPLSLVIARLLVSAIAVQGEVLESETDRQFSLGVCEFLAVTDGNMRWSGLSDTEVLERLLRMNEKFGSGEPARALPEAIAKELDKLRRAWDGR